MALCCSNWCNSIFNDISILRMIYLIQCSMCKAVLESGADQQTAESLNDGIIIGLDESPSLFNVSIA